MDIKSFYHLNLMVDRFREMLPMQPQLEYFPSFISKTTSYGASLVAPWLGICLPMQGTRVQALVWEDPTCRGATKPVRHNY